MKEIYQQTVKDKIQRQNQEFSMEGLRVLDFTIVKFQRITL